MSVCVLCWEVWRKRAALKVTVWSCLSADVKTWQKSMVIGKTWQRVFF